MDFARRLRKQWKKFLLLGPLGIIPWLVREYIGDKAVNYVDAHLSSLLGWMATNPVSAVVISTCIVIAACAAHAARDHDPKPSNGLRRSLGLKIDFAKWYCTRFPDSACQDVTGDLQGRVSGMNTIDLVAHQDDWGDVCKKHGGDGHEKCLDVMYTYQGHINVPWDHKRTWTLPTIGPSLPRAASAIATSQQGESKLRLIGASPVGGRARSSRQFEMRFRNAYGHAISVSDPKWSSEPNGVNAQISGLRIHIEKPWPTRDRTTSSIHVDPDAIVAVLITFSSDYSETDLERRSASKLLGILSLIVDRDNTLVFTV